MVQEFTSELEKTVGGLINDVHTAIPARITSFDADKCTCGVSICGKFVTNTGEAISYPEMSNIPVVFPCSIVDDVGIAFPIKPGDGCLVVFSETELDEFKTGSESVGSLKFDLTNAVCIPGLLSQAFDIAKDAQDKQAVVIKSGSQVKVTVQKDKIDIKAPKVEVVAPIVDITGDVTVNGTITSTGSMKAKGVMHPEHTHTCPDGETDIAH